MITYEYLTIHERQGAVDNQNPEWPTPLHNVGRWSAKGWEVVNSKILKPRPGSTDMCAVVFLLRRQNGLTCFMDGCAQPLYEMGMCRQHFDRKR